MVYPFHIHSRDFVIAAILLLLVRIEWMIAVAIFPKTSAALATM